MARKNEFKMQFGVLSDRKWSGAWQAPCAEMVTPTLQSLRAPARYHVISDAQLKRDLQGRTLADVYRDNRAGRANPLGGKYEPRTNHGSTISRSSHMGGQTQLKEYLAECYARNHIPHPASIDSDHPMHAGQRERCPKRETVSDDKPLQEAFP